MGETSVLNVTNQSTGFTVHNIMHGSNRPTITTPFFIFTVQQYFVECFSHKINTGPLTTNSAMIQNNIIKLSFTDDVLIVAFFQPFVLIVKIASSDDRCVKPLSISALAVQFTLPKSRHLKYQHRPCCYS